MVDLKEPSRNQVNLIMKSQLEFCHFDAANSYPTSPFKGRNIVDLDFLYNKLLDGHKPFNTILSLTQYHRERLICLTSILYLSLHNSQYCSDGQNKHLRC